LALPEVLESHHVTGRHTLLLKIRTENTESLHQLIGAIRELPGVARTETMIVLATQHERQRIPLRDPAGPHSRSQGPHFEEVAMKKEMLDRRAHAAAHGAAR
jgi:hypothetical protein